MTDALKVGDRVRKKQCCCSICGETEGVIIRVSQAYMPYLLDNGKHTCWHNAECLEKITNEEPAYFKQGDWTPSEQKILSFSQIQNPNSWDITEEPTMQAENKYPCGIKGCYAINCQQHATESVHPAELKLEVGKKYVIPMACDNPCKLVAIDEGDYIFRDNFGALILIEEGTSILAGIKEHREPYKKSIECYIAYAKDVIKSETLIDHLVGFYTHNEYFHTREEAEKKFAHVEKFRFTVEKIEEQNAK